MDKKIILLTSGLGGTMGSYIPVLLGANGLGGWSILGALIGGLIGIWVGYRISNY